MAQIGSLSVNLELNSASFISDLGKSAQAVAKNTADMTAQLGSLHSSFDSVAKLASGLFAGDFGLRAIDRLKQLVEGSLDLAKTMGGDLGDAAEKVQRDMASFKDAFDFGIAQGFIQGLNEKLHITQGDLNDVTVAGKKFGLAIGEGTGEAITAVKELLPYLDKIETTLEIVALAASQQWSALGTIALNYANSLKQVDANTTLVAEHITQFNAAFKELTDEGGAGAGFWQAVVTPTKEWSDALKALPAIIKSIESPLDVYKQRLQDIGYLTGKGLTDTQAFKAQEAAVASLADSVGAGLTQITGNLAGAFKDNKAIAIANAVVNTAAGITKAFADPKLLFPLDFAVAASVAAAGAAQIATIESASPGTSTKPSVSGGGAGSISTSSAPVAGGAGQAAGAAAGQQQSIFIQLQGQSFNRDQVASLVTSINQYIADGGKLILS